MSTNEVFKNDMICIICIHLNTSISSIKTNINHFFQRLKFQDIRKKYPRDIKYEYEYIDLIHVISQNKCNILHKLKKISHFHKQLKVTQHKHKIDMQSSQVYEEKNYG